MRIIAPAAAALAAALALAAGMPDAARAGPRGFSLHLPGIGYVVIPDYGYRGRHYGKRHHKRYRREGRRRNHGRHHRRHRYNSADRDRKAFCGQKAQQCANASAGDGNDRRLCMQNSGC